MTRLASREALNNLRDSIQSARQDTTKRLISLCAGSGCAAYGTATVYQALRDELAQHNMLNDVEIKLTGCHGFCEKGPILVIHPEGIFYPQVKGEHIPDIVAKTIKHGQVVDALIFKDPATKKKSSTNMISPSIASSRGLSLGTME